MFQLCDFDFEMFKDLGNLFDLLDSYLDVVCLLEDQRFEPHIRELLVKGLEKLSYVPDDRIGLLNELVAHFLEFLSWICLCIDLSLQFGSVRLLRKLLFRLQVLLRHEKGICLDSFH